MDQQVKPIHNSDEKPTCLYPSKPCSNPRGVKRNGELHNFCDFHRDKANFNQRRLEHKRKYQHEAAPRATSPPLDNVHELPALLPSPHALGNEHAVPYHATVMEPDDIYILQELLKGESPPTDYTGVERQPYGQYEE